jgi:hypothetical protein
MDYNFIYYVPTHIFAVIFYTYCHHGGGFVAAGISCHVGKQAVAYSRLSNLPDVKERLPPAGAVSKLNERVRKIGKVNSDIADWLQVCALVVRRVGRYSFTCSQERRKVEDAYVAALKKLVRKPLQDVGSDMGYSLLS